jgi:hypothetical protein
MWLDPRIFRLARRKATSFVHLRKILVLIPRAQGIMEEGENANHIPRKDLDHG